MSSIPFDSWGRCKPSARLSIQGECISTPDQRTQTVSSYSKGALRRIFETVSKRCQTRYYRRRIWSMSPSRISARGSTSLRRIERPSLRLVLPLELNLLPRFYLPNRDHGLPPINGMPTEISRCALITFGLLRRTPQPKLHGLSQGLPLTVRLPISHIVG